MTDREQEDGAPLPRGSFPQTRWSVVLAAQNDDPAALASFCHAYWFPLYAYARRTGRSVDDAEDLTQSFFERMLSIDFLSRARQERGRLRSFLLHSFNNFAAEEWRKRAAQKRGGGQRVLEIDGVSAEERYALESRDTVTPEVEYERAWVREILRQTMKRLEASYESAGKGGVFNALRDLLVDGSAERSYLEIAASLGISEASARFAAFTLRQRYRALLRETVAETVAVDDDVENELAHMRVLFQT